MYWEIISNIDCLQQDQTLVQVRFFNLVFLFDKILKPSLFVCLFVCLFICLFVYLQYLLALLVIYWTSL